MQTPTQWQNPDGYEGNTMGVRTLTGRYMDFSNPDPQQVYLPDIVHNLGNLIRFQGGMPDRARVSVLHHSCVVLVKMCHALGYDGPSDAFANMTPEDRDVLRWALMHDTPEAYLGDVPRPLKNAMTNGGLYVDHYRRVEEAVEYAIMNRFGFVLTPDIRSLVSTVDYEVYELEKRAFRMHGTYGNQKMSVPVSSAQKRFLYAFVSLGGEYENEGEYPEIPPMPLPGEVLEMEKESVEV